MTWDLFCRTVYARQKDVAALDPGATGEARRAHVERLLGLGRVREAAAKAREEHKRIKASLDGMRAAAVDVSELRARLDAASRRAMDTPAVAAADAAASEARTAFDVGAPGGGGGGGARDAACGARAARGVVDGRGGRGRGAAGRSRAGVARSALAAVETVERIEPSAGGAPEAEALRRRWQALSEAVQTQRGGRRGRWPGCASTPRRMRRERSLSRRLGRSSRRSSSRTACPRWRPACAALEAVAAAGPLDAASAQERGAPRKPPTPRSGRSPGPAPAWPASASTSRALSGEDGAAARSACGRSKGRARS